MRNEVYGVFSKTEFSRQDAAAKLFRRRERKIGTGAGVLTYVKVMPVAPFRRIRKLAVEEKIS